MHGHFYRPNLGFEEELFSNRLSLGFGVNETRPISRLSLKYKREARRGLCASRC